MQIQLCTANMQHTASTHKVSPWQHLDCHLSRGLRADVERFDNHAEGSMTKLCYLYTAETDLQTATQTEI